MEIICIRGISAGLQESCGRNRKSISDSICNETSRRSRTAECKLHQENSNEWFLNPDRAVALQGRQIYDGMDLFRRAINNVPTKLQNYIWNF
jgi:hypothetical protein